MVTETHNDILITNSDIKIWIDFGITTDTVHICCNEWIHNTSSDYNMFVTKNEPCWMDDENKIPVRKLALNRW